MVRRTTGGVLFIIGCASCVSPECTLVCKYLGGGRKEPRRRSPPTIVSGKSEDHGDERATVAGRGTCLR